ncbi:uncharacterized protein TrAFT101_006665 [Trichoderma asperellum]|uniref:uncharacterized protein n=1 Tax=Trichoderma asperellum TaxID=101201 RepID=UPI00332121DE|nr:hypothetical protein TrAFT101_006665 [Trichoderma asperellum]
MPYAELVNCWAVNMHIGSSWTVNLANLRGEYIAGEFRTKGAPIYGGPTVDALGRVATGRTFPTIHTWLRRWLQVRFKAFRMQVS